MTCTQIPVSVCAACLFSRILGLDNIRPSSTPRFDRKLSCTLRVGCVRPSLHLPAYVRRNSRGQTGGGTSEASLSALSKVPAVGETTHPPLYPLPSLQASEDTSTFGFILLAITGARKSKRCV